MDCESTTFSIFQNIKNSKLLRPSLMAKSLEETIRIIADLLSIKPAGYLHIEQLDDKSINHQTETLSADCVLQAKEDNFLIRYALQNQ